MKFDLNILNQYIEKGLVEKNNHPHYPISIYNYSRECQFNQAWDEITLACRGLVLDNEGNVVARSFNKFFNMEELKSIPNEPFEVFEKMDGSLGILFYYNGEWILASKGSFISDQAIKGKHIFTKQENIYGSNLSIYNTYVCEIIYPENRIVVDYGDEEKLVLLGVINHLGVELPYNQFIFEWHSPELIVKRYDGITDYKQLKSMVKDNQEGFIVRFRRGMRMKVKGEEYVRLHRLLTNFSNVDIWEYLKEGKDLNILLERVPDEFDAWVRKTTMDLKHTHYQIAERCGKIHDYFRHGKYNDVDPEPTRKEFAEYVLNSVKEKPLHGVLFAMWDKSRDKWTSIIWKLIRPTYQKPFWNKEKEE